MALPKRVKNGGSYYEGGTLAINSASADYVLAIIPTVNDFAANGFSVTPTTWGVGDSFSLHHMSTTADSGGVSISTLANGVYFLGGGISIGLDFASLELVKPGESLRFIYHNTASVAGTVYTVVETIK